ncbi:MAG: GTP-binding protein [Planctomycetes bacterium]|nr:GTP-binding protein [Planctomycetota bacterium]
MGKTAYVRKWARGEFIEMYDPTLGVVVQPVKHDGILYNVWDCAGVKEFSGRGDHSYAGADGAIVMFDLTDVRSYESCGAWVDKVREMAGDIPIVLCGNKCDMEGQMDIDAIALHREKGLTAYYSVSAKNNYNLEKPVVTLADALG